MQPFANVRLSLNALFNSHYFLNLLLRLLDCAGHVLVLLVHISNQCFVNVLFADNSSELAGLHTRLHFRLRKLVLLLVVKAKAPFSLTQ